MNKKNVAKMIYTDTDNSITMKGSTKVTIKSSITIMGTATELPINITADFKDIQPHLHQLYMQSMMSSYGDVNVYDNTKDEITPPSNKNNLNRLERFLSQIWLGFSLSNEFRNIHQQWPKI